MKFSKTGYRLTKNGAVIKGIEQGAIAKDTHQGQSFKSEGTYYFFSRKQGSDYIYLP